MAQNRARRSNKNFAAIDVDIQLALTTLGDGIVKAQPLFSSVLKEDLFVLSTDLNYSVRDLTAGELQPATVGLAHGDYSVTEIKEKLDNDSYLGPGDKIEQEKSRRLVRKVGTLFPEGPGVSTVFLYATGRNGGRIIRTKLKFMIQSGHNLQTWVWNRSGAALQTGSVLEVSGTVYGRWVI